jgi:hypothetical protein
MKALRVVIAVLMTLLVIVSARYFGPNRSYVVEAAGMGIGLSHKAPRGHSGEGPAELDLKVDLKGIEESGLQVELVGQVKNSQGFERFSPVRVEPEPEGSMLVYTFEVPHKAPTTRYYYRFEARIQKGDPLVLQRDDGNPMMVKFKGNVPAWVVITHILAMFGGFFLLIWSALYAFRPAFGKGDAKPAARLGLWAWITMFLGGLPIGFLMNYYAFDVFWEAFPFGKDVTDNKTQIALLLWGISVLALYIGKGKKAGLLAIGTALVVLAIFLIPHSAQIG